jgi:hypothetical protein
VNNDQSFVDISKAAISYASSNPAVATVDAKGLVTAVGDDVATIKVAVNGVTGSTVIVVGHSLTLSIPPIVLAGNNITATTTFTNGGNSAINNITLSLTPPAGYLRVGGRWPDGDRDVAGHRAGIGGAGDVPVHRTGQHKCWRQNGCRPGLDALRLVRGRVQQPWHQ